jgi:predicted LPLAT superfamily acyltransferase
VPFFGDVAPFPQGPYVLAAILKAPVYLLFCTRDHGGFEVCFTKFADRIDLPRQGRTAAIRRYAEGYVRALEEQVAARPLQWFNFYSFWHKNEISGSGDLEKVTS